MEKKNLSLKNLYKLLMSNDFPIYSESVIGKNERKGQTVLNFWRRNLVDEFRKQTYGKMIWRNEGKRNRYTSHLCNRSEELKSYIEYARELASEINKTVLLQQITRFSEFLANKEYKHDILLKRIKEMIKIWEQEDPHVCEEIITQFKVSVDTAEKFRLLGMPGKLFSAAYIMTIMTFYAAAGNAMDHLAMSILRQKGFDMESLWKEYNYLKNEKPPRAVFLTSHAGIMQDNPLPPERFFGREEELYDLKEMILAGQKCLITGIGGMGKTELLRQLLRHCNEQNIADKFAVIPYENNLTESIVHCFPGFTEQEPDERCKQIIRFLEKEAESNRLVILIDNYTDNIENDEVLERLQQMECCILISTRQGKLNGFETYPIKAPSVEMSTLIFRDNYGVRLSRDEREVLNEMLRDEAICHPLTLKLMGKAARAKGWSVQELKEQIAKKGSFLSWVEDERTIRLSRLYHELYTFLKIPAENRQIAELFTLLPRGSYSAEFLVENFKSVVGNIESVNAKLNILVENGWLDTDNSGYYMHPLIAQCLRKKVITEKRIEDILSCIKEQLVQMDMFDQAIHEDENYVYISRILVYISEFVSGSISPELMVAVLKAMVMLVSTKKAIDRYAELISNMLKRCHVKDDHIEVLYGTVLGYWSRGEKKQFEDMYIRQKENLTVSRTAFIEFCVQTGCVVCRQQDYQLAQKMLKEALSKDALPNQCAKAYLHLAMNSEQQGDSENTIRWIESGIKYMEEHSECNKRLYRKFLLFQCQVYIKFGRKKTAEEILNELKSIFPKDAVPSELYGFEVARGSFELYYGDLKYALECYRKALVLLEDYYGKLNDYYLVLGQIAIILQRMKQYEEALESYQALLEYAGQIKDRYMLHLFSNNISVVYLEMNEPEKALSHLSLAHELVKEQGGIALAEVLRNIARAYGQLAKYKEEQECLRMASPLLDECYGPKHPRAEAARQRLEELVSRF